MHYNKLYCAIAFFEAANHILDAVHEETGEVPDRAARARQSRIGIEMGKEVWYYGDKDNGAKIQCHIPKDIHADFAERALKRLGRIFDFILMEIGVKEREDYLHSLYPGPYVYEPCSLQVILSNGLSLTLEHHQDNPGHKLQIRSSYHPGATYAVPDYFDSEAIDGHTLEAQVKALMHPIPAMSLNPPS